MKDDLNKLEKKKSAIQDERVEIRQRLQKTASRHVEVSVLLIRPN